MDRLSEGAARALLLDDEHRWYRYHHLFADVLRARLEQSDPELLPVLHQRAARCYEASGLSRDAVRDALAAADYDAAARLIEQMAPWMTNHGQVVTLRGWIEAIPAAVRQAPPWLSLDHAWTLVLTGRPWNCCPRTPLAPVVWSTSPSAASPCCAGTWKRPVAPFGRRSGLDWMGTTWPRRRRPCGPWPGCMWPGASFPLRSGSTGRQGNWAGHGAPAT